MFKFKCKNCGSKNTNKVKLKVTPIVMNYCSGKKMPAIASWTKTIYTCNDCCGVSELEYYNGDCWWDKYDGNIRKYIKEAKKNGYLLEVIN